MFFPVKFRRLGQDPMISGGRLDMRYALSIRAVRTAIRKHRLSFPSQVPVFLSLHRPEIQWRIVVLYFVRGWSPFRIGQRYGITTRRVAQLARQWTRLAMRLGYVDHIPPAE